MKTLMILSLVTMLILSGCIENADNKEKDNDSVRTSIVNSSADKIDIADSIIGKWTADNESVEFLKEGKMILSQKNESPVTGSYKFIDNNQIMINVDNLGTNITWKIVNISDNESVIFTGKFDVKFNRNKELNNEFTSMHDTGIDTNIKKDWCTPGATMSIKQDDFIIKGITTYTDDNNNVREGVCKAEKTVQGGSSIIYFNEGYVNKDNNQFFAMKSSAKGSNAHAEASSSVKVGN